MNQIELPSGYSWSFGRSFRRNDDAFQSMMFNLLMASLLIFIVMAALFESMAFPLATFSSILFSIVGVFWFFFFTGTDITIMAMIGILILFGVVVNNGIVLIDHINTLRKEGFARKEAVIIAGKERLRPILMTAGTTILGLIPLAFSDTQIGGDGPQYYPMARAIVGGLAFSTVITLIILPSIYLWMDDLIRWCSLVFRGKKVY